MTRLHTRVAMVLLPALSALAPGAPTPTPPVAVISPLEALKITYNRGNYANARQIGYVVVWEDTFQPDGLKLLVMSLQRLKQTDEAAAFAHILLRVLDDPKLKDFAQADAYRKWCRDQLTSLDAQWVKEQARYLTAAGGLTTGPAATTRPASRPAPTAPTAPATAPTPAGGRSFTRPEDVDDLWMTQVDFTPHPLHGLYAWKMVGGRKDASPTWIHNTQGIIHRSGAKLMDDIDGRKGVLYGVPNKLARTRSCISLRNSVRGAVLRMGVKAYGFSFVLNVVIEGKQVFSKTIDKKDWQDLKVPLGEFAGKDVPLTLELVVPEDQKASEGAFFDYIDFFKD